MNTKKILPVLALFLLAVSCQTGSFTYHNDVFTRSTDSQYQIGREQRIQNQHERENLYDDDLLAEEEDFNDAQINRVDFDDLDMYDFFYTSRLRRFHTHVSLGWGFYDPFFTNMFWYTRLPANWGVSIYLGHSWWWPTVYFRPWFFDWGWHSRGFAWGWGWGWGWGWNSPWRFGGGYWGGFWDGFNAGFWAGYYHNRFDRNTSFFYGHRNTMGPSNGRRSNRSVFGNNDGNTSTRHVTRSSREPFNQRFETVSRGATSSTRNETTTTGRGTSNDNRGTTTVNRGTTTDNRGTTAGNRVTTNDNRGTTTDNRGTTNANPGTNTGSRQPETTRPTMPSTRQDTYNSGFRPDNSRSTPTHTPSNNSRGSGSSFSSPSNSGGASSGGSGSRGGGSGSTRR
jgi:hypothetical protein